MTRGISIARRHFLTIAGLTLTAAGFGRLGSLITAEAEPALARALVRRMLMLLHRPGNARVVGRAYLQRRPNEADTSMLVSSLVGGKELRDLWMFTTDQAALYRAFRAECGRDFEEGELVSIGGWYLARSEARVCALAYLMESDGT